MRSATIKTLHKGILISKGTLTWCSRKIMIFYCAPKNYAFHVYYAPKNYAPKRLKIRSKILFPCSISTLSSHCHLIYIIYMGYQHCFSLGICNVQYAFVQAIDSYNPFGLNVIFLRRHFFCHFRGMFSTVAAF